MACGEHGESIAGFLAKAPDPPVSEAVTSAINLLKVRNGFLPRIRY